MSKELVKYTESEKQVARQAREYLNQHGICMAWQFYEDNPPSKEVAEFLLAMEGDIFDVDAAEILSS